MSIIQSLLLGHADLSYMIGLNIFSLIRSGQLGFEDGLSNQVTKNFLTALSTNHILHTAQTMM